LPVYLSNELEGVQKRAMHIIFPLCSYNEALVESGLTKLSDRRQELVDKLFKNVLQNEQNKLHELLPARNTCTFNLRNMPKFKPAFKTNRFPTLIWGKEIWFRKSVVLEMVLLHTIVHINMFC
ncbi:unnamed protein product, partial [Porites lobata]